MEIERIKKEYKQFKLNVASWIKIYEDRLAKSCVWSQGAMLFSLEHLLNQIRYCGIGPEKIFIEKKPEVIFFYLDKL